ncbi:MAG: hypothetical protein H7228_10405 [Polaromonas sp.]|nr:hypothetical protein [Polaromonas sp.]
MTLLTALILPACSAVKIAYNQSPELAYWYLDGYVDFNDAQSLQVKADLNRLKTWHRQTQLPGYIDSLQKLQQQMPLDFGTAQACSIYTDARQKLLALATEAEPAVAALAASIGTKQIALMERKFAKGNADYREEFVDGTPKARRAKRYKLAVNRAEMLYGSLDDRQLALIDQVIAQSRFDAARAYAERLRRQQDVLQTLRAVHGSRGLTSTASGADKTRTAMRALLERSVNSPDEAYRDYQEKITNDTCKAFADLHNSTSALQRKKAVETINSYEQDLKALASQIQP